MENKKLEQLAALDNLVSCFLGPAVEYFGATSQDAPEAVRVMAQANVLEAFFWLDLGTRLRIYPHKETQALVSQNAKMLPGLNDIFFKGL